MKWRAAGARWDLLAEDHPIDDYERAPIGEVGCVDTPSGAAALLATALGLALPPLLEM